MQRNSRCILCVGVPTCICYNRTPTKQEVRLPWELEHSRVFPGRQLKLLPSRDKWEVTVLLLLCRPGTNHGE